MPSRGSHSTDTHLHREEVALEHPGVLAQEGGLHTRYSAVASLSALRERRGPGPGPQRIARLGVAGPGRGAVGHCLRRDPRLRSDRVYSLRVQLAQSMKWRSASTPSPSSAWPTGPAQPRSASRPAAGSAGRSQRLTTTTRGRGSAATVARRRGEHWRLPPAPHLRGWGWGCRSGAVGGMAERWGVLGWGASDYCWARWAWPGNTVADRPSPTDSFCLVERVKNLKGVKGF